MIHPVLNKDFRQISTCKLNFKKFSGKTVLISGASGMIGGYLVDFLLYLNELKNFKIKIIAVARNKKRAQRRFTHYTDNNYISVVIQDIIKPIRPKQKVDYIIHAASQASPKYFGVDPVGTILPNVVGTKNLLELAHQRKAEFLYVSSSEVYGQLSKSQIPTKESNWGSVDPTNIRSCYAESKRLGETMCVSYFHQHGVIAKIVRPFHVYGPGMDLDDGRVFADFTRDIIQRKNLQIKGNGNTKRSFCYLGDAVEAIFTVILSGKAGEAYNVGNSQQEVSIKELAKRLVKIFPDRKLKVRFTAQKRQKGYLASSIVRSCPDISKLRKLGWHPKHSIEDGFRRTISTFL